MNNLRESSSVRAGRTLAVLVSLLKLHQVVVADELRRRAATRTRDGKGASALHASLKRAERDTHSWIEKTASKLGMSLTTSLMKSNWP